MDFQKEIPGFFFRVYDLILNLFLSLKTYKTFYYFYYFTLVQQSSGNTQESQRNLRAEQGRLFEINRNEKKKQKKIV